MRRLLVVLAACHASSSIGSLGYLTPPGASDARVDLGPAFAARYRIEPVRPAGLATTDGSELELRALDARVTIDGPIAHTELQFTFHNGEARIREGRFSLVLPPDAAVGRFAMQEGDQWREALVVSRAQGRELYEERLKRRIDPALLEHDAANGFSARVFPIGAGEDKLIAIAYDEPVAGRYTLALHGLPVIPHLAMTIDRDGHHEAYARDGVAPEDVVVEVAAGDAAAAFDGRFAIRMSPDDAGAVAEPIDRVLILADASASRAPILGRQVETVRALVAALPPDAQVAIAAFDHDVTEVYRGPARAADPSGLLSHGALGASDLGAALDRAAATGATRVVIVGDGTPTLGERDPARLAARVHAMRVDAVQVGAAIDRDTLRAIVAAGAHPGAILDGRDPARVARQLQLAVVEPPAIRVDGATELWIPPAAPGDPRWVFGAGTLGVVHAGERVVELAPRVSGSVARVAAAAQIATLTDPAKIREVATANGLVSGETSMIVLDGPDDENRALDEIAKSEEGRGEVILIAAKTDPNLDLMDAGADPTFIVARMTHDASARPPERPEPERHYEEPYTGAFRDVMAAIRRGDRDGALAIATRWQASEPGDVAAIIALGEAFEARGQGALAARAYASLLDLYPDRADLARAAGERLDRVSGARALAIDAYRRALAERPDQVTTYRLLAYALWRAGATDAALELVRAGMSHTDRDSIRQILAEDARVLAGAAPNTLRVVLAWETDANDVDLHVYDRHGDEAWFSHRDMPSGGTLRDDITTGFGPEMFEVDDPAAFPYRIAANYFRRGPMGIGLGTAQIVRTDARGRVTIEDRPFVIQTDNAMVQLGTVQ